MTEDQGRAPIVEALLAYERQSSVSLGTPGHKGGKGAPSDVRSLLGKYAFIGDATLQKGIDDRRESKQVCQEAEHLAALAWGAEHCYFSTNGTSLSNHVAMLTVANPGDTVLVSRNSHKSLTAALIIAKVKPVFLEPDFDSAWDIEHGIPAAEVERKLAAHPQVKGVFVVAPTYYGIAADIQRLAGICHERNVPLVVDEAWGPHYAFHEEMPPAAIRCGADMSVGSIHKTMAGLEQASILLLKSKLIPFERFNLCYDLLETTSTSVPILASIDATRRQFVQEGAQALGVLLENARWVRKKLAAIDGVKVMGREVVRGDARFAMEDTKIYFDISGLGLNGYEAEDWLMTEQQLSLGLSDERCLLATFTIGNDGRSARKLVKGIRALAKWARSDPPERKGPPSNLPSKLDLRTELVMTPAEAFFAAAERVPLESAAGRIAAEMVSPYPPGIPRILPGERLTEAHVDYFQKGLEVGFFVMDASDMSLKTLRVVRE